MFSKIFKIGLALLILNAFLISGCGGEGGNDKNNPPEPEIKTSQGTLRLSTTDTPSDYIILNSYDTVKVNSDNSYEIPVNTTKPTFSFAISETGSHVYVGLNIDTQEPTIIDSQSTAEALVLLNPLLVLEDKNLFLDLINLVKNDPEVKNLALAIDEIYQSSNTPLEDERLTDALAKAILSVLTGFEKFLSQERKSYKSYESQQDIANFNRRQQSNSNGQFQIQNFDMGALTLEGSSYSALKIDIAEAGPSGIKTNTSWIVHIRELDINKINWEYRTSEWPVPIFSEDLNNGLILNGGFSDQVIIEGKIASGWLGFAVNPIGVVADYLSSKLIPDYGIPIIHDGVYAVFAFSGSLSNENNELEIVKDIDWQREEWTKALSLNIICASCDVIGMAFDLPNISKKLGEDFAELLRISVSTIKKTLSEYPDIDQVIVITTLNETIKILLEFALSSSHTIIKEVQDEGLKKIFHTIANVTGKVIKVWSGTKLSTKRRWN